MVYGMSHVARRFRVSVVRSGPTQERVIIDLGAGEVATRRPGSGSRGPPGPPTARGSSMPAIDGPGLQFVARTGESVTFGEELGQVVALGVRWPDAELDPDRDGRVGARQRRPPARPDGHHPRRSHDERRDDLHRHRRRRRPELGDHGTTRERSDTDQVRRRASSRSARPTNRRSRSDKESRSRSTQSSQPTARSSWTRRWDHLGAGTDSVRAPWRCVSARDDRWARRRFGGATIDVPDADLLGSDGRGGLVVLRAGDVFAVGVDGAERLTTGELSRSGPTPSTSASAPTSTPAT